MSSISLCNQSCHFRGILPLGTPPRSPSQLFADSRKVLTMEGLELLLLQRVLTRTRETAMSQEERGDSSSLDKTKATKNEGEVIQENDLPSEITFEKRSIPKQRAQSVLSVLSSVSLKSLAFQVSNNNNPHIANSSLRKQPVIPPQQNSQPQFINTNTHIQAPAIAASSKRRASFEIGQRLPFNKDDVESDGDVEVNETDQKNLTDDALKKLSSFSKFQPAEVDYSIPSVNQSTSQELAPPRLEESQSQISLQLQPPPSSSTSIAQRSGSNTPDLSRLNNASIRSSSQSLAKRPSSNPSSAAQKRETQPTKLLATTTSSQNLLSLHQPSPPLTSSQSPQSPDRTSLEQQQTSLQTLSDPRRPMYVPAVLRQSDTNLKPEDLKHINEQNIKKSRSLLTNAATSLRSQTSHWKLSFEASSSNAPTKVHWRRDISRNTCAYCEKPFTFFERRHHCRRCGDIFCAEHTSHLLKLGPDAQFTIGGSGMLCKVCDKCAKEYEDFVKNKFGQGLNGNVNGKKNLNVSGGKRKSIVDNANIATSVPADWSWSSF